MIGLKFRAWHKQKHIMQDVGYIEWTKRQHVSEVWCAGEILNYLISNVELMQFTGLVDKNGKEIYEGDILKCPVTGSKDYHGEWYTCEILNMHGQWITSHINSEKGKLPRGYTRGDLLDSCFEYDMKLFLWGKDYIPHTECEIIGNIYENPELLEGVKN